MRILRSWLMPAAIAVLLFVTVRPTFAQVIEAQVNLAQYLTANNVEVGDGIGENGFRQIYYLWQDEKYFVTNTAYPNGEAVTEGEYITWMGQASGGAWQVFLYHIPTDTTIQLSSSVNSANPKVSGGKVVWEGWVIPLQGEPGWQVFFFDGKSVKQLTSGDLSMHPDIDGDFISYGRRNISNTWRSVVYSISKREAIEVAIGISSKRPKVRNDRIILAGTGREEVFPLTVDDLFLLDLLGPLSSDTPQTITEEEIIEELEVTLSAEVIELSPSPTSTPEATPNP